ncbi:mitochondrial ribosomal subunit protein-domain-containing protein [Syncephalastrum racemosum]|uniref:Mitochondrial ribosomal subunit protein-domain-containing protein n=1 Tax=Syncephalastrum racemosum TaxID=13706 RepID=A0A1X2H4I0_SYNRA|nr:mitochondrial ribosomal subunit protein-domain-containing protein [Syncephalastrum racemosum]
MHRFARPAVRSFSSSPVSQLGRGRGRKPEKKFDVEHMERFQFDDQTTIGHELFENIRTVRQYLRKTEFELPKLSAFKKEFVPPKDDQILKFKSHSYLGEGHPVERKSVLSVNVNKLNLTDAQRHKFLLLAGPRYNVDTQELVLSSEKFPYRNQNKKFVSDTLDRLLAEAKDTKDTFADIPLKLREPKKKLTFPKEWARPPKQETRDAQPSSTPSSTTVVASEQPQSQSPSQSQSQPQQ